MIYMDAMVDRIEAEADARVEQMRAGYIFARDASAHRKWLGRRRPTTRQRGLVGDALEAAVMGIASMFPENVERVTA